MVYPSSARSLVLLALSLSAAFGAEWSLSIVDYNSVCSPRKENFTYTFQANSAVPVTAVVLTMNSSWPFEGIKKDSATNITGLRFDFSTALSAGQNATLTFASTSQLFSTNGVMTFGVVLADGTVGYSSTTDGIWPVLFRENPSTLNLTMQFYDFSTADNRSNLDFETYTSTDNKNITYIYLNKTDRLPIYYDCYPNSPCTTVHSKASFDQWFRSVPGVNIPLSHNISFSLVSGTTATYRYKNDFFFPLDGEGYGWEGLYGRETEFPNGTATSTGLPHNFGFCGHISNEFSYHGGETFNFTGDDDVFVFINNTRVIDLGGSHFAESTSVNIDNLGLEIARTYNFDFFMCERHSRSSDFAATTTLSFSDCDIDDCGYCIKRCAEQEDSDGDNLADCVDACPYDSSKSSSPGACGCNAAETCAAAQVVSSSVTPSVVSSSTVSSSAAVSSAPVHVSSAASSVFESSYVPLTTESSSLVPSSAPEMIACLMLFVSAVLFCMV